MRAGERRTSRSREGAGTTQTVYSGRNFSRESFQVPFFEFHLRRIRGTGDTKLYPRKRDSQKVPSRFLGAIFEKPLRIAIADSC